MLAIFPLTALVKLLNLHYSCPLFCFFCSHWENSEIEGMWTLRVLQFRTSRMWITIWLLTSFLFQLLSTQKISWNSIDRSILGKYVVFWIHDLFSKSLLSKVKLFTPSPHRLSTQKIAPNYVHCFLSYTVPRHAHIHKYPDTSLIP